MYTPGGNTASLPAAECPSKKPQTSISGTSGGASSLPVVAGAEEGPAEGWQGVPDGASAPVWRPPPAASARSRTHGAVSLRHFASTLSLVASSAESFPCTETAWIQGCGCQQVWRTSAFLHRQMWSQSAGRSPTPAAE